MIIGRMIRSADQYLSDPNYRFLLKAAYGMYNRMPDEEYLSKVYEATFGKKIDWANPRGFNEKLQWLKINDRNPKYSQYVDKYRVREYVASKLGEDYLIPLIGVWERPEEIDFQTLPERFVLKWNHNSGLGMVICKEKSKLNPKAACKRLMRGFNDNYYLRNREWPYKDIQRKILAEPYMEETDGSELKDYKIHCFHGEPQFILVCSDRFSKGGLKEDFYDTQWNRMELHRPYLPRSTSGIEKPEKLEEMLQCARILAQDLPFARIDLYVIQSQIYFGEITLFPASGFKPFAPEGADEMLGKMLKLGGENQS